MTHDEALEQARAVIRAEAFALASLADHLNGQFLRAASLLWMARGKVIVTGMGKAGLVGRKIAATFRSTGTAAAFLHPGEAAHGDLGMIGEGDVLLALSNSGETDEVRAVAHYCRGHDLRIAAITSRAGSPLTQAACVSLILPAVPEGCPIGKAPMASAVMMMALGDAMAARLMSMRSFTAHDFLTLHHGGYLGKALRSVA